MPWLMFLVGLTASAADNQIYVDHENMTDHPWSGEVAYFADGNINADYTDATVSGGYLDGPELSVFDWEAGTTSRDCALGVTACAEISTTSAHTAFKGYPTRPSWESNTEDRYAGTVYTLIRDASRNYFDAYNTLSTDIADTDDAHELVVIVAEGSSRGGPSPCTGSCMRPHTVTGTSYYLMAGSRPDGRDGGAMYYQRPKIFLRPGYSSVKVPVHEFGHYYNRIMAREYGTGGFAFGSAALWEEQALDEGLGYWYVSDYSDTEYLGRSTDGSCPTGSDAVYTDWEEDNKPSCADEHHLGDVFTGALWDVRETTGCDVEGVREAVLSLVDAVQAADFADVDPFGGRSVMRGFAASFLQEAFGSGACTTAEARAAAAIFADRELVPRAITQADTGATSETSDYFGHSLATGDFDGDGYADLIVGAPYEDASGNDSGMVHVIYGTAEGILHGGFNPSERLDQSSLGSAVEADDRFGWSVAVADFDGDGYDDLAVGSPYEDLSGSKDAGFLHVFYGGAYGLYPSSPWARVSQASFGSMVESGDLFGYALAAADFNDDGYGDLAIGSPGEDYSGVDGAGYVHVLYGSASGIVTSKATSISKNSLGSTAAKDDQFGAVLTAGDFDGDGYDDLAVAAPLDDGASASGSGAAWVVYGSTSGIRTSDRERIDQATGGSTVEADDRFGSALTAGDFDGDGYDDLAVGSPYEDLSSAKDTGYVMVFFGSNAGVVPASVTRWSSSSGGTTRQSYAYFSRSLAAGDIDGDGRFDLAIGLPYLDDVGSNDGLLHLYAGSSSRNLYGAVDRIRASDFAAVAGSEDNFGWATTFGDFDGDGDDDLAISARARDADGANGAGLVYISAR